MLSKTLTAGLTAAAIAGLNMMMPVPASAASFSFFYGPDYSTKTTHNGKWATEVCHAKYRWGTFRGKPVKIKVGTECRLVLPIFHPLIQFNAPPKHMNSWPMKHKY